MLSLRPLKNLLCWTGATAIHAGKKIIIKEMSNSVWQELTVESEQT